MSVAAYDLSASELPSTVSSQILATTKHMQLTTMSVDWEIPAEVHQVDQFTYIIEGMAKVEVRDKEDGDIKSYLLGPSQSIIITAGTTHRIINKSTSGPLKLFSVYSPMEHPVFHSIF